MFFSSFANACDDCDKYWGDIYKHKGYEQKYRYQYEKREVYIQGKLSEQRAKNWQKIRGRGGYYGSGRNVAFYMIP